MLRVRVKARVVVVVTLRVRLRVREAYIHMATSWSCSDPPCLLPPVVMTTDSTMRKLRREVPVEPRFTRSQAPFPEATYPCTGGWNYIWEPPRVG